MSVNIELKTTVDFTASNTENSLRNEILQTGEENAFKKIMSDTWRQQLSAFPKKGFRILVSVIIISVGIAIAIGVSISTSHSVQKTFSYEDGDTMTFELDNCEMTIEVNSVNKFEVYVDAQNHPQVLVTVNNDINYVSVSNTKPLWQKYDNYFCRIIWYVPKNVELPDTIINAKGRRISTLVGTSVNWSNHSLSLKTDTPLGAIFRIFLDNSTIGNLNVQAISGDLDLQRLTIENAKINTTDFNIYLNIQHSVILRASETYDACLNSFGPVCDKSSDNNTCDYMLSASLNDIPSNLIEVECSGDCFIHMIVAKNDDLRSSLNSYSVGNNSIAFNAASKTRVLQAFQTIPTPDMVLMGIRGPGAPKNGRWIWSNRMLYLVFPPTYLDVFSFYLLSPIISSVNISMTSSFCPGTNLDIDLDSMVAINNLFKKTINTTANPENIYAFQQYENVFGYPSQNFVVGIDTVSGEYYLYSPSFSTVPRLLIILVTNLILTAVAGIFYFYVFIQRLLDWRRDTIELWGDLFYGKSWPEQRNAVYQRAGIFYMLEFVVGFPKQNTEYWRMMLTAVLQLFVLILLGAPCLTAVLIYVNSSQKYVDSVPAAAGVAYAILLAYAIYSIVYLFLYYLNSNIHYFKWISYPFYIFVLLISFLSFVYIVNIAFWIILGALIKPTKILPYASAVIVIVLHAIGTYTRVQVLLQQLKEEAKKPDSPPDSTTQPSTSTSTDVAVQPTLAKPTQPTQPDITGSLTVQSSIQLFKKTKILELRDATIREQIVQEIVLFVILLLFFLFILVGFTTIGSNQDVASGISSLMVFLVGGGVNIPLAIVDTPEAKRKRWEKQIVKETEEKKNQ